MKASTMVDFPPSGITGGICLKSPQHSKTRPPQGACIVSDDVIQATVHSLKDLAVDHGELVLDV